MNKAWKFTMAACLASLALWVVMLAMEASNLAREQRGHLRTLEWLVGREGERTNHDRGSVARVELHQLQNYVLDFNERLRRIEGREPPLATAGPCVDRDMPRIP